MGRGDDTDIAERDAQGALSEAEAADEAPDGQQGAMAALLGKHNVRGVSCVSCFLILYMPLSSKA